MNLYHEEGAGRFKQDGDHPLAFEKIIPGTFEPIDFETVPAPLHIRLGRLITDSLVVIDPDQDLSFYERQAIRNNHPESAAYIIRPSIYRSGSSEGVVSLDYGQILVAGYSLASNQRLGEFSTYVSRKHALIELTSTKQLSITDLDSTNGTYYATGHRRREASTELPFRPTPESFRNVQSYTASIAAESHPSHNEDSYMSDDVHRVYGIFDGVGGSENGQLASNVAADIIRKSASNIPMVAHLEAQAATLQRTVSKANDEIMRYGQEAQTTAVIMKLHSDPNGVQYATIASCGDSRAYLLRNGHLVCLTTDHTPFRNQYGKNAAKERQLKFATTDSISQLSEESVKLFKRRHVIGAALGYTRIDSDDIDVEHVKVQKGDLLILTTDGIHDNLTDQEMQSTLTRFPSRHSAHMLTQAAAERSRLYNKHLRAKPDDMTAVAVEI